MHTPLSKDNPTAHIRLGDLIARYEWSEFHDSTEFSLIPADKEDALVARRQQADLPEVGDSGDWAKCWGNRIEDSLVQVAVRGGQYAYMWGCGRSMRNSLETKQLCFSHQDIEASDERVVVRTVLETAGFIRATHVLEWRAGIAGVQVHSSVENLSSEDIVIEHLSSFCLGRLSPFAEDDMPERLNVHRFRTAWSNEGRHESRSIEDLHLERCWGDGAVNNIRFGQLGSMPVRGFFPIVGLEDTAEGVFWGAQLAWNGSWQMEVYRRDDPIVLTGGQADFEFGQWAHTLRPGAQLDSPAALLTASSVGFDDFCNRMVSCGQYTAHAEPQQSEADMGIVFNEWASTWGNPTHDYLIKTGERLKETQTKYIVIDDGWAARPEGASFQTNGDWVIDQEAFPESIVGITRALKEKGFVTGVWFEFEVANRGSKAYEMTDHLLKRHGQVLKVGDRHFWDLRDEWTLNYLSEKVIEMLRDNECGYMKVDYNDSIGVGCDPVDEPTGSLGEGLRQHIIGVNRFFAKVREELPHLVLENCSSGGHRLDPIMVGCASMSSFSDAHETIEIPVIAANLLRIIPLYKNQIWAVMRPKDTRKRTLYSLTATLLGRMAISGDVAEMSDESFALLKEVQAFYVKAYPALREGFVRIVRDMGKSYRYPKGWQAVSITGEDKLLVVAHTFEGTPASVHVPLHSGGWRVSDTFGDFSCELSASELVLSDLVDFQGAAVLLER